MVSSDWYNLDQDNTLGGNNPSILKIPSQKAIKEALNTKQDTLVSGTNIKTINGVSLLGSGDIPLGSSVWAEIDKKFTDRDWYGFTYDGEKFVAMSWSGWVRSSTDGETWTNEVYYEPLLSQKNWIDMCYGNSKYVAIGTDGYIATSSDFENWTSTLVSNLGSHSWKCIAYDGTKYVYLSTSTDGTTWTAAAQNSTLGNNNWVDLIYDGSKFIALAYDGYISTSTDGTTWTSLDTYYTLGQYNWNSLCFASGRYMAVSYGGYFTTSSNGTQWKEPAQNSSYLDSYYGYFKLAGNTQKIVALSNKGYLRQNEVSEFQLVKNLVTSVSSSSTDSQYPSAKCLYEGLDGKQAILVSGTNIKTINNESVLGNGNITISGGTPTDVQINGTSITSNNVANIVTNSAYNSSSNKIATMSDLPSVANMQTTTNLVTSVSSSSTDTQYPSAKLFYDTCGNIETLINAL